MTCLGQCSGMSPEQSTTNAWSGRRLSSNLEVAKPGHERRVGTLSVAARQVTASRTGDSGRREWGRSSAERSSVSAAVGKNTTDSRPAVTSAA
jgi:hypothetical protein